MRALFLCLDFAVTHDLLFSSRETAAVRGSTGDVYLLSKSIKDSFRIPQTVVDREPRDVVIRFLHPTGPQPTSQVAAYQFSSPGRPAAKHLRRSVHAGAP
jgi:hypothetical protein